MWSPIYVSVWFSLNFEEWKNQRCYLVILTWGSLILTHGLPISLSFWPGIPKAMGCCSCHRSVSVALSSFILKKSPQGKHLKGSWPWKHSESLGKTLNLFCSSLALFKVPRGLCGGSKYTNKAQSLDYERTSLVIAPQLQQKNIQENQVYPPCFPCTHIPVLPCVVLI